MTYKSIDLSVIIVVTKGTYIFNCIKSVNVASTKLQVEIIVIDNATKEKVGNVLKKKYPDIKIIRREKNGGFGENNNMGMKIAKGRYILLLNDDTKILHKKIFKEMLSWMDKHPKVGVSSCAVLESDEHTYQGSGGSFPTLFKVFAWMFFIDDIPFIDNLLKPYHPMHGFSPLYKNENYFKEPHKQDWLTGAFYLMRESAMGQVGFFDEDFFLYVEEVDLSYRFAKAGWEIWYLPYWRIVHYGSATIGNERALSYEMQNIKLFYKKHFSKWKLPIVTVLLKFGALIRIVVFGLFKGTEAAQTYVKVFKAV